MDEFVEWLKSRLRIAGVIGAAGLIALGIWVELRGEEAPPVLPRQELVPLALFADTHHPALPRLLPANAAGARGTLPRGVPVVLVTARGEPVVAVCSAPLTDCRRALPGARTVSRRTTDGATAILVLPAGDASAPSALSPRAREFWRAVPLARERPAWLDTPPP